VGVAVSAVPPISGLLETALYVDDPMRSRAFYRDVFGFESIFESERLIAMAMPGPQVLLLFRKGMSSALAVPHDGSGQSHLAVAIPAAALDDWDRFLTERGIVIVERTAWERGGTSLYFRDPDGHLLEIATPGVWSIY
jgi:catechol 2,3-dioxygenase-like lactoylglutathione lyase family enzyme